MDLHEQYSPENFDQFCSFIQTKYREMYALFRSTNEDDWLPEWHQAHTDYLYSLYDRFEGEITDVKEIEVWIQKTKTER